MRSTSASVEERWTDVRFHLVRSMHSLRTLCGYHSCAYLSIYSARLTCIVILTPFFLFLFYSFFFFGGLAIPISQAIMAHLFSYNIQWSATIKEVQRSNFFKEIPKIARRFWFPMSMSIVIIAGMIILSTSLVPFSWQVNGSGWAVIFPLSWVWCFWKKFNVIKCFYENFLFSRLSVSCHILFPVCCFILACFILSHIFFWLTDCVEPMAYGFLVLMTLLDLI